MRFCIFYLFNKAVGIVNDKNSDSSRIDRGLSSYYNQISVVYLRGHAVSRNLEKEMFSVGVFSVRVLPADNILFRQNTVPGGNFSIYGKTALRSDGERLSEVFGELISDFRFISLFVILLKYTFVSPNFFSHIYDNESPCSFARVFILFILNKIYHSLKS